MSVFQGILLGILQGIAEFLPISSSGHLAVVQNLFGLSDVPLLFDVFLHLATLLAVVLYFRKKIWALLCTFARLCTGKKSENLEEENNSRKYILGIILGTLVTGVIGVFVEKVIKVESIKFVCAGFIITSIFLITSSLIERKTLLNNNDSEKSPSWWQSLIIGLAQGIGTLPGISRSGSTIAGALYCGVNRAQAGEFSFILSIPAILGAFILEVKDIGDVTSNIGIECVIAGCAAAFASGYLSLTWLMKLIKKGKLEWFALYLIPAGILGMIFLK